MVDLAMGYSNEQPTVVGELIIKSGFLDCGPYLLALTSHRNVPTLPTNVQIDRRLPRINVGKSVYE